ncbi:tetraacyldisaccharide 4'-kinase [Acetobacter peroxydans]|uniref:tetraacyldisaccharide 4'-kinase n=1 Tax=Acetobacter peroxydans TaxID=104098 RepID=UPI0023543B55|nr:tetraacyldisaccharide 4'-kinase [Acetobacter peroxydans]MCH4142668.1 tetraacyldisaccharide 4'-kinase [Acetobacter peroxydans]MCI1395606.1 tetraacyldisaccharide 4'-kinase [Acetobacter peroxydans]MCI1411088.1 tetraacyldisaccharide 4'-kinase [Acetobacter peroxydans]MCI1440574.1 tetraacyldisaccharide 4'-kinase [Acetobacter peroxydans]MCI1567110.1 tetraacyldisaccharide 4'-kinase [Acetobacter peroxydans]
MVMLKPPAFWRNPAGRVLPALLGPVEKLVIRAARRRQEKPGWCAPVPVLCCGNVSVGGTGKTPVVMDLAQRLIRRGRKPHILSRGYGGRVPDGTQVDPSRHKARDVGDEPLLLVGICPVWVGGDRALGAQRAIESGADCLLMDDGFQNPGLAKTISLLVVDGSAGIGNGHVLPAGPLREPLNDALARSTAVLVTGADVTGVLSALRAYGKPVLQASFAQSAEVAALMGQPCVAFAGIGRPEKFFDTLRAARVTLVETRVFPDHYPYTASDLARLEAEAQAHAAVLVTTPKDHVRLPPAFQPRVIGVGVDLIWRDEADPEWILDRLLEGEQHGGVVS